MKKGGLATFLILIMFWPFVLQAAVLPTSYPRLANYFLKWEISDSEAKELAKWDLLILDMEVQENSRAQLQKIRDLHPGIIILAYITSEEITSDLDYFNNANLRQDLDSQIAAGWWLKDPSGRRISNWPGTQMLNISDGAGQDSQGRRFNDYLPIFVTEKLQATGLWDGVFFDNAWGDISWLNGGRIDLDNDGLADKAQDADRLWSTGFQKILKKTKSLAGTDFIIIGNGRVFAGYQKLMNGMMLESFPPSWENGGTWSGAMATYDRLPSLNQPPSLPIINVTDKNSAAYRHLRFGLSSALLGNGFFSFDYDITNHGQTWWFDEYDVKLGPALATPYNLLGGDNTVFKPGLWRRDFKYGSAIVNSTDKEQRYVFAKEEFNKIKGTQDTQINNGAKINYLQLAAQDGLILLKRNTVIKDSAFTNGYFYRLFDASGASAGSGFFSYLNSFAGSSEVIIATNGDEKEVSLTAGSGSVELFNSGRKNWSIKPFTANYKGALNIAADISGGYFRSIATGPSEKGGPQISIFKGDGQLQSSFFAYDKKLRGGVSVALGDLDGDGHLEVITGPGKGNEPLIKVFDLKGNLKNSWLAYDKKFLGGVNVALGDLDGDGHLEVITGPGKGGGPQIRIFKRDGSVVNSFFAYDTGYHGGIKVSVSDMNGDGRPEILAGIKNFY